MGSKIDAHLNYLIDRYPQLIVCREDIMKAYDQPLTRN